MKTTAIKAIIALREFTKLGDKQVSDFKSSFALYKLKKALNEIAIAFEEEKKKLAEQYGGVIEDGNFKFETPEKQEQFTNAVNEQAVKEIDADISPIDIAPYMPTANQIELIADFIKEDGE